MHRNVGPKERYARLLLSAAAGAAAARTSGWPRTALGTLAAASVTTGITGYCPINQAVGRNSLRSGLPGTRRDAEIRRDTAVRSALALAPSPTDEKVTRESDLFGQPHESMR